MIEHLEQNSFSIRWRLVHACNYVCPGCNAPRVEANCVLARFAPFYIFGADGKDLALPDEQIVFLADDISPDKREAGIADEIGATSCVNPQSEAGGNSALVAQEGIAGVCDGKTAACGSFCGIGADILRIEPDGRFYGAFCAQTPANPPLWQDGVWPWQARGALFIVSLQFANMPPCKSLFWI